MAYKKGKPFAEMSPEEVDKFRVVFLRAVLRNASQRWPAAYLAEVRARVSRGTYRCAGPCGKLIRAYDKRRDHKDPVVDPAKGFVSWDEFIARMFAPTDGWQILCKACHEEKTNEEKAAHAQRRRLQKAKRPE